MAEFCLACWNKLHPSDFTERDYVLTKDFDLCEGCASFKPVVLCRRFFLSTVALDMQHLFHPKETISKPEHETVWEHFTEIIENHYET